jgi:hypothetical protein
VCPLIGGAATTAPKGQIMFKSGIQHLLCFTVFFLSLTPFINGQPSGADEIELALAAIGGGSASEMKSRLFTSRITVFDDASRTQAVAALSASLRDRRITQGRLLRRVAMMLREVLQLHGRSGEVELFLFDDDLPSPRLWRGCVLLIPNSLAEQLFDGELAGIFAHELGHSYFEDEMAAAVRTQDVRDMRVVELKCDAVALLSLKLLGHDPALYLRGLRTIEDLNKRKGRSKGNRQSHPELVERAQFSQRIIKSLS